MSRSRSHAFFAETVRPASPTRACDMPGCEGCGEFRAPKSRTRLNDYYWFCLEHVRAYNASWDYYAGMKPEQIESEIRNSTTWDRPTWPLGKRGGAAGPRRPDPSMRDNFGFFDDDPADPARSAGPKRRASTPAEELALSVLDLAYPITMEDLKTRYKLLVKRHHPDANGGDKAAEERLKIINQAYTTLRAVLSA